MRNLIMAEKTIIISVDSVAHFEEQLIEIKKHMQNAMDLYMSKPGVSKDIIDELKEYKDRVVWAVSSDELMKIIQNTNKLTNTLLKAEQ
ncbi:MAG: hypothetical protein H7X84_12645 [Verrucomicrobia bacterium]|nr:hypothetical protein [Prolixibacteraceae bacterium]